MRELKTVYFADGHSWDCKIVSQSRDGLMVERYGRTVFFPWHKIDRVEL